MRSMTGCGRSQRSSADWEVAVEVRTVNHRFLDLSCRLPRTLSFLEETVRQGRFRRDEARPRGRVRLRAQLERRR